VILVPAAAGIEWARRRRVSLCGASSVVHAAASLGRYMAPTNDNTVVMITQEATTWTWRDVAKPYVLNAGARGKIEYYGTRTGRRDFRITKARAPTIRADSIQYLAWLALNTKGVATMAMAQISDQMILEVGVMELF